MKNLGVSHVVLLLAAMVASTSALAHATGNISLKIVDKKLVATSVDTGEVLGRNSVYQTFFGVEREWDERKIYTNVDAQGTPRDDNGNVAFSGGSGLPFMSDSGSTKSPLYVVDDYAWSYYDNAFSLPVRPGEDGSVDNLKITLNVISSMKVWNGSKFVLTGGEKPSISIWEWTTVASDGVSNKFDGYKFPDGGWYAVPVDPVRPDRRETVPAGTYIFAPGDHYHWLIQLGTDKSGARDKGVYLMTVNFSTDAPGVKASQPIKLLIANGLGSDWASSVSHAKFAEALSAFK